MGGDLVVPSYVCDLDSLYMVPIAWNDQKGRFEPVMCINEDGLVLFYDGYACPEPRCPLYNLRIVDVGEFPWVLSRLTGLDEDAITERMDTDEIIRRMIDEFRKRGVGIIDYRPVYWCYTGDKECEEEAWEAWQDKLRQLAHYLNQGYEIVELQGPDEGDSVLIVVPSDHITRLRRLIKKIYYNEPSYNGIRWMGL